MSPENLLLVTGATGQIGGAVVRLAMQQGYRLRLLARSGKSLEYLTREQNVEIVEGDMLDPSVHKKMLANVTHICHCAARVGDWGPAAEYWQTNVEALKNLLDAIPVHGQTVNKFVHFSSLGVYEPRDHYGTTEDEPLFRNGLDAYNQSKAASEELLLAHDVSKNVNVIVLRPGFVYGPGDRHVLPGVIKALKKGVFIHIGGGEQKLDNVSVHNVAQAAGLALATGKTKDRVFNITDNENVSRTTFVNTIARMLDLPSPMRSIPRPIGKALASACDAIGRSLRLKEPPLLSKARYKFLALNLEFSITRAREQLGYNPSTNFIDGMQSAIDWVRKEASA